MTLALVSTHCTPDAGGRTGPECLRSSHCCSWVSPAPRKESGNKTGKHSEQMEKDGGAAMWKRMNLLPSAAVVRDTDQLLDPECQNEIGTSSGKATRSLLGQGAHVVKGVLRSRGESRDQACQGCVSTLGRQRRDTGSQLGPSALGKSLDWESGATHPDPGPCNPPTTAICFSCSKRYR